MEDKILKTAKFMLNKKHRILAPAEEAWITYPDFDPCRPIETVAVVHWPATVNLKEVILTYAISNNDPCY